MTIRTTVFPPGSPCWVDLATSDPGRAQEFYAAVLGWQFHPTGPEFGGYVLATLNGRQVAGLIRNTPDTGTPDGWSTYFASADLDADLARATAAGASVVVPALAVGDLGAMAVLADPAGSAFGLWQGAEHTGYTVYAEPGSVAWTENHGRDFAAGSAFYADLFGWSYQVTSDTEDFRYLTVMVDGEPTCGLMDSGRFLPPDVPGYWAVYFGVEDVDAAVATASRMGATVVMSPEDSPFGRVADLLDPTGASFKLHSPVLAAEPEQER